MSCKHVEISGGEGEYGDAIFGGAEAAALRFTEREDAFAYRNEGIGGAMYPLIHYEIRILLFYAARFMNSKITFAGAVLGTTQANEAAPIALWANASESRD